MKTKRIKIESQGEVLQEIGRLKTRLERAEATLQAIHSGDVDAIIVQTDHGERVYTFEEGERPYRVLIEEMSQGAVTLNLHGEILYCNQYLATLLGHSPEELVGCAFTSFLRQDSIAEWTRLLVQKGSLASELYLVGANDDELPVRIGLNRMITRDEMDLGLIITDLREQKHVEQILLDRAAREEAARLEIERLYQQVVATSRLKDEFLASLSHELRTPLNVILGYSELLLDSDLNDSDALSSAETIQRNALAQAQMVEDLLDISAISSGQLKLSSKLVRLQSVIEAAIESVWLSAEAKGVTISSQISPATPLYVRGDSTRLQQAVWNLLSNAVKFLQQESRVNVALEQRGRFAVLTVEDYGEGIEEGFLPFIFEPFRQEDGSLTRRHGGLGLGLSLVRYLVEAHGGSIDVESKKRQGARFTITLPLAQDLPLMVDRPKTAPKGVQPEAGHESLTGERILVVDDHPDGRLLARSILQHAGAIVETASSVEEALSRFQEFNPNVLVSDIGMPEKDGCELILAIRSMEHSQGGRVPALALSGFADPKERQRALKCGYDSHVAKPVQKAVLIKEVKRLTHLGAERSGSSRS